MCTVCGCESAQPPADPAHHHDHGHPALHTRVLQLEQDILAGNNHVAQHVREHLAQHHTLALNLVSSPGSGKTTLLVETIRRLSPQRPVAVIEGDQQTSLDAERIRATGAPAIQINTGKGCHLDARMVHDALHDLPDLPNGVLLIENVGNLVCPASFDLGEAHKVLVFSITEGEDKPLKYPDMFQAADLVLLSKCDLLPYLAFDLDKAMACIHQVNPKAQVFQLSATKGMGMNDWLNWIERECAAT
ncbi:MAG: hydrogenase nickel incorporation protein HypB [Burkholderiales bacterium]|nr:hydrogenase nickel incorporation protein HypB [Burkholderiales bacterium]MDE2434384.1 hydrogenase nickel incorporation protein HypB [Burkholderiales bacterium]